MKSRELSGTRIFSFRFPEAIQYAAFEITVQKTTVPVIDGCGMDFYQHFIVTRNRPFVSFNSRTSGVPYL
jgi:hypothetical protein